MQELLEGQVTKTGVKQARELSNKLWVTRTCMLSIPVCMYACMFCASQCQTTKMSNCAEVFALWLFSVLSQACYWSGNFLEVGPTDAHTHTHTLLGYSCTQSVQGCRDVSVMLRVNPGFFYDCRGGMYATHTYDTHIILVTICLGQT